MSNLITILPKEILELSTQITESKKLEVSQVLAEVFDQTTNWNQEVSQITVLSVEDKKTMEKAKTLRLKVKKARLEAEKRFDAKRAEVQIKMVDYKTEDTLWLKAKQSMQAITKGIEEKCEWQEKFAERLEKEQKKAKTQARLAETRIYKPDISEYDINNLSDEMFLTLLNSIKKDFEDRIEAEKLAKQQEDELKEKKERLNNRRNIAFKYGQFFGLDLTTDPSEEVFEEALELAKNRLEIDTIKKAKLQADLDKANKERIELEEAYNKSRLVRELEEKQKVDKEKEEQELIIKAEKNNKFKEWLLENNFNSKTDSYTQNGNEFTLIRVISKIII
jgi:hypothetical protein